jgi:hypothetical protein
MGIYQIEASQIEVSQAGGDEPLGAGPTHHWRGLDRAETNAVHRDSDRQWTGAAGVWFQLAAGSQHSLSCPAETRTARSQDDRGENSWDGSESEQFYGVSWAARGRAKQGIARDGAIELIDLHPVFVTCLADHQTPAWRHFDRESTAKVSEAMDKVSHPASGITPP